MVSRTCLVSLKKHLFDIFLERLEKKDLENRISLLKQENDTLFKNLGDLEDKYEATCKVLE